jgi:cbb3-type cytochrome oxidase subunit 3
MYDAFYRASQYLAFPLLTALFFLGFFAAVVAWVANGSRREVWERSAALPLEPEITHVNPPQEP